MHTKDINKLKLLNKLNLISDKELASVEQKPLINIENLSVNFKRGGKLFEAVKNANLDIKEGEVLGLVGESGSGKTTLGRATISLWDHSLGKVEIEGKRTPNKRIKSVSKDNVWVYKKGQMIFQDPTSSLNRQQKVVDIVYEGLKNFKTIENEYKEYIQNEQKLINEGLAIQAALEESKDAYKEYVKSYYRDNHIIEVVSNSKNKKVDDLAIDFARYQEIKERITSIKELKSDLPKILKKKINIIKSRKNSDKIIINEEGSIEVKNLKESMNNEIIEYAKFKERFEKDEEKTKKRLDKRISRFYKTTINKTIVELPDNLKKLLPKNTEDIKLFEKAVKTFEKDINTKNKLNDRQKFYAESISLTMQVIVKKKEKVVTPLNSIAFDNNYIHIDDLLMDRVHFFEKLVSDLEKRIEIEEKRLSKVNEDETIIINYHKDSLEYLNKYKEILISSVKEWANISIVFKKELLNHEDKGIKEFYKFAIKQNKINDILKTSILTWKSDESIKYEKRSLMKKNREIEIEISSLNKEIEIISSKYNDIENPMDDLLEIISLDMKIFESQYDISDSIYKQELKKLTDLIEAENIGKAKINKYKKILKSKKQLKEISIERIKETLLKVGLNEDALNKYPSQFSGGQKQRIGIARTIINKPKFIIADEPISALDVSVQAQVINLLKQINDEMGLTMLFIAHDLQMVHYISSKIAVIYRGTIVEYGDSDKVYKNPKHPYTKSLIGAMPSLEEVGKKLEVSNYNWNQHEYNEFSMPKLQEVEKDHFVFGTDKEIKNWK